MQAPLRTAPAAARWYDDAHETMPRERLAALQLARLRETVLAFLRCGAHGSLTS